MRLNLAFNKHILTLLNLYNSKDGTLSEIKRQIGSSSDNFLYNIKRELIKIGVLKPFGIITARKGRGFGELVTYKIDKEALNQLFFGDLPTKVLRDEGFNSYSGVTKKSYLKRDLKKLLGH